MIIGLTGAVGAGKSTILNFLKEKYNALIIETDKLAHDIYLKGKPAYLALVDRYGKRLLDENNEISRPELARIIFSDDAEKEIVNNIIHPFVRAEVDELVEGCRQNEPQRMIIVEAALLIEAGYKELCDELWYVYVSDSARRERLKQSRGYSDEKITNILAGQLSDDEFRKNCDFIIDNSFDSLNTINQVEKHINELGGKNE